MRKVFALLIFMLCANFIFAQKTVRGVIIQGDAYYDATYTQGNLSERLVNGVSILFGAITWGGSTETSCAESRNVCKIIKAVKIEASVPFPARPDGLILSYTPTNLFIGFDRAKINTLFTQTGDKITVKSAFALVPEVSMPSG